MATKTRRGKRANSGPKPDPYQLVTDAIVSQLEAGVVPWHKPWRASTEGPRSLSSGKAYRGVNVWVLSGTAQLNGYDSRWWGTYKQIAERGGQVRKGEKATPVVFWKFIEKRDADGKVTDRIPFLRYFTVFNSDQADNVRLPAEEEFEPVEPIESCERIAAGYLDGPTLKHGGDRAYYSPSLDHVQIPKLDNFDSAEHYYGTLFHEFVHSTGGPNRLDRANFVSGRFGDPDYSKEELVAEIGAAFLCGEAGIEINVPNRASYIAHWLKNLGDDPKLIVSASGAAQKAADRILGSGAASAAPVEDEEAS